MKLKYLVLAASCFVLCASTVWARPKILDRSVIGYWKFESGSALKDSSGYGSDLNPLPSDVTTSGSSGFFAEVGYLSTPNGTKLTATLGKDSDGVSPSINLNSYHTIALWCKTASGVSMPSSILDDGSQAFANLLNDHGWHFVAKRYQGSATGSDYDYAFYCDTQTINWGDGSRAEVSGDAVYFPFSITGSNITIGGELGGKIWGSKKTITFKGDMSYVVAVNRMMTKGELTRLGATGETYIYPIGAVSFAAKTGWSTTSVDNPTFDGYPGAFPGAAYIVDQNKTLIGTDGGTFGGSTDKKVSLTLGRLGALKNLKTGANVIDAANAPGKFEHGTTVGAGITFYDLRLNDGIITPKANNQSLTTTLLDVDARSANPFSVAVGDGLTYTFNAGGQVTGSGVLAKTGAGKLVLNNFTAAAGESPKLRLAAGSIKTPRLDGYTGGTVIVDGDAVTFTGADTLSGTIQVQYNGTIAAAEATYPVLNAPTLTSASQVAITAAIPEKYEGAPKLENGVVSLVVTKKVAPLPDEDKGTKPVLLWQ